MLYRYYTEIKYRILLLFISGVLIFLVSYIFKEVLLSVVVNSYCTGTTLELSYFIFTDVVEVFSVYVCLIFFFRKTSFIFSISLSFVDFFYTWIY